MAQPDIRQGLRPAHDVVARVMGDGAVLVHLPSNKIFELNPTGAYVWELIESGIGTLDEIATQVTDTYDVERSEAIREVATLIDQLVREGLLET